MEEVVVGVRGRKGEEQDEIRGGSLGIPFLFVVLDSRRLFRSRRKTTLL
jgi:hypothetical protein